MNSFKQWFASALLLLSGIVAPFNQTQSMSANAVKYAVSESEIVMEINSGRVLYEKNADAKLPIASLTKIFSAITIIEEYDVNKEITVPKETVGVEGSSVYLKSGERYKVLDLLFGLMLRSGNDCAETLATVLSGSVDEFMKKANKNAYEIGARNTSLKTPHGLDAEGHCSTARDLAVVTAYAMKNPIFKKIVSTKIATVEELGGGEKKVWKNKNKMLSIYDGANGVKTGYTVKSGRCLASSAERKGMEIVAIVLNSPQMFERSAQLLDEAFDLYDYVKIIDGTKFKYVTFDKEKKSARRISPPDDFYYPIKKSEKIKCELNVLPYDEKNRETRQNVGEIKIYCSKQLIFFQKLYTLESRKNTQ